MNKLEGRREKLEGQVKGLRETLPSDLKRLRMSLEGVRKYYGVQRLLALEVGRDGGGPGHPHATNTSPLCIDLLNSPEECGRILLP